MTVKRTNVGTLILGSLSFFACESGTAEPVDAGFDAESVDDARVPDAQVPDDAAEPDDADVDAAASGCTDTKVCPLVRCTGSVTAFPAPLQIEPELWTNPTEERVQAIRWRLASSPEGSTVMAPADTGFLNGFTFVPDLPGDYVWCPRAQTRFGLAAEPARCCRTASVTGFTYMLKPSYVTMYVEEVEFAGGLIQIGFDTNQPFAPFQEQGTVTPSSSAWTATIGDTLTFPWTDHFTARVGVSVAAADGSGDLATSLRPGDSLTLRLPGRPGVVGAPTALEATITLQQTPEPADGPKIEALVVEATAQAGGTVRVKFDPSRVPGTAVLMNQHAGRGPQDRIPVRDDGVAPDVLAGDGWFTGPYLADARTQPGTYSVLTRAFSEAVEGSYFRAAVALE